MVFSHVRACASLVSSFYSQSDDNLASPIIRFCKSKNRISAVFFRCWHVDVDMLHRHRHRHTRTANGRLSCLYLPPKQICFLMHHIRWHWWKGLSISVRIPWKYLPHSSGGWSILGYNYISSIRCGSLATKHMTFISRNGSVKLWS